jgi:hypothetical protein
MRSGTAKALSLILALIDIRFPLKANIQPPTG